MPEQDARTRRRGMAKGAARAADAEEYRSQVHELYEALIAQVREELRHEREPGRRRWIPAR
jgi:hypothetical protein